MFTRRLCGRDCHSKEEDMVGAFWWLKAFDRFSQDKLGK
uniref:Uncharacterized protein n=1 Tax=Anguilla anguilla TaxID=7936 RepID=A0A0E9SNP5_ANGAN